MLGEFDYNLLTCSNFCQNLRKKRICFCPPLKYLDGKISSHSRSECQIPTDALELLRSAYIFGFVYISNEVQFVLRVKSGGKAVLFNFTRLLSVSAFRKRRMNAFYPTKGLHQNLESPDVTR